MRAGCHTPHKEKGHDSQKPQDPRQNPKWLHPKEDRVSQLSGRPLADAIIVEVFAGTARVSACLRHFGLSSACGVDHVRQPAGQDQLSCRKRGGPPPLRSDRFPNGLQGLSFVEKNKVSQANKLYHLTVQIIKYAVARNTLIWTENP